MIKVHIILSYEHFLSKKDRHKRLARKNKKVKEVRYIFRSLQTALPGTDFQLQLDANNLVHSECSVKLKVEHLRLCNMVVFGVHGQQDESAGHIRYLLQSNLSIGDEWSRKNTQHYLQPCLPIANPREMNTDQGIYIRQPEDFDFDISGFTDLLIIKYKNKKYYKQQKVISTDLQDFCKQVFRMLGMVLTENLGTINFFKTLSKKKDPDLIPEVIIVKAKMYLFITYYYFDTINRIAQEAIEVSKMNEYYQQADKLFQEFSTVLSWSNTQVVKACQKITESELLENLETFRKSIAISKSKTRNPQMSIKERANMELVNYRSVVPANREDLPQLLDGSQVFEYVNGCMEIHLTYTFRLKDNHMVTFREKPPVVFDLGRFLLWFEDEDYVKFVDWNDKNSSNKGQANLSAFKQQTYLCRSSSALYFKGLLDRVGSVLLVLSEVSNKIEVSMIIVNKYLQSFPSIRCTSYADEAICVSSTPQELLYLKKEVLTGRRLLTECYSKLISNYANHSKSEADFPNHDKCSTPLAMNTTHIMVVKQQIMQDSSRSSLIKIVAINHMRVQPAQGFCYKISSSMISLNCFLKNGSLFCFTIDESGFMRLVGLVADKLQLIKKFDGAYKIIEESAVSLKKLKKSPFMWDRKIGQVTLWSVKTKEVADSGDACKRISVSLCLYRFKPNI